MEINNLWSKDLVFRWLINGYKERSLHVSASANKTHTMIFPFDQIPSHIDIQISEKSTGLLLLFENEKDIFTVRPKPYKQKYVFDVRSVGKNVLLVLVKLSYPHHG